MQQTRIGFIGLGNMGGPMAANLARSGKQLVVRDLDTERQAAFVAANNAISGTETRAFADVDVLVTMLPDDRAVRAALFDSRIVEILKAGVLVLDTSSANPVGTIATAAELAQRGISMADAPVSGGIAKAIDGKLSIMLGAADDATADRAIQILEPMSGRIFRTGGLGSGHAMKALNNYCLGAGFVAVSEAFVVGRKFGLDPKVIVDVINASSGRNVSSELAFVNEVLTRRFQANFAIGLFAKDLGIAADLARSIEVDAPLAFATAERLASAREALGAGADYTEAVKLWEQLNGVPVSTQ